MADTRNTTPANEDEHDATTDADAIRADARTRVRFEGVNALARKVGCSPAFLSQVLHGIKVPGTRLAARLRARGIATASGRRVGARAEDPLGGAGARGRDTGTGPG